MMGKRRWLLERGWFKTERFLCSRNLRSIEKYHNTMCHMKVP